MHINLLTPILLLLSSASSPVLAKGNNNSTSTAKSMSTGSQCRIMAQLERIVSVANNATRLAELTKDNPTLAAEVQAKAPEAATTLATMQSNTTLVAVCAQRAAVQKTEATCVLQSRLQKAVAKAANSTTTTSTKVRRDTSDESFPALRARKNHNGTHTIDVAAAQQTLAMLASNATLQQFCAMMTTQSNCREITSLNRIITMASNATLLAEKFNNNATKIARFQAKAANAQTKLTSLTSNTTLTSICNTQAQTSNTGTTGSATSAKSNAPRTSLNGNIMSSVFGIIATSLVMVLL